ncbi:Protein fmp32, mitochondrial [Batrachochytrium dendrobatidis]
MQTRFIRKLSQSITFTNRRAVAFPLLQPHIDSTLSSINTIQSRTIHSSRIHCSYHNFDTYKFVQRLEADGFRRNSAEAVMGSLSEVVGESVNNMSKTSVTKTEFEKSVYMSRVDFNQLRSEIQLIEKNEFALLRADIGRVNIEVEKLRVRMAEDLRRMQSSIRLELSLDKGRIRDEQAAKEIRIKEADSKIDTEVSIVKTQMETIQWELFKTLFPLFCAAGALFFSYMRFVK